MKTFYVWSFNLLFYSLPMAIAAHITQMMYFRVNWDGQKTKKIKAGLDWIVDCEKWTL